VCLGFILGSKIVLYLSVLVTSKCFFLQSCNRSDGY